MELMIKCDGKNVEIYATEDCDCKMLLDTALNIIENSIKDIREIRDAEQAEKVKNMVARAVLEMES